MQAMRISEIESLWQELELTRVDTGSMEVETFLEALRRLYTNGGAELRVFQLRPHPLWETHAAHDDLDRLGFPAAFLHLPTVQAALPAPVRVADQTETAFLRLDEPLEDALTIRLVSGGAYVACDLSPDDAEEAAIAFCEALFGDGSSEVTHYLSELGWHGWLHDLAWDATFVSVDRVTRRVAVLMLTDMD